MEVGQKRGKEGRRAIGLKIKRPPLGDLWLGISFEDLIGLFSELRYSRRI